MPDSTLPVGTKVVPASTAHPFYGKVFRVIKEVFENVEEGAEYVIAEIEGFAHMVEVKLFHKDVVVSTPAPATEVPAEPVTATTAPEEPSTGTPAPAENPPAA